MTDVAISVRTALVNTRTHLPEITAATSFVADLRCDAVDMVCIEIAVSDDCNVELPALAFESCRTVGELTDLVDRLREQKPQVYPVSRPAKCRPMAPLRRSSEIGP